MILFVHIPKTAGTSFRIGLEQAFGRQKLLLDYGPDSPETDADIQRLYAQKPFRPIRVADIVSVNNPAVLCGHFPVSKYLNVFPDATVISFVREPLQRCYSEYLHFQRHKNYNKSFKTFFSQKSQINLQSRFLEKLPPEGIIGCNEYYEQSLSMIFKSTGLSVPLLSLNRHRKKLHHTYPSKIIGHENISLFYQLNDKDLCLYKKIKKDFAIDSHSSHSIILHKIQYVKSWLRLSMAQQRNK